MHDAADKTASSVAPVVREYRFNKFGSVGKAAGFFLVTTGYVIRSVLSGFEGERTLANVVRATPALAVLIYAAVILGLLGVLVMAMIKPANHLRVDEDEVIFTAGDRRARLAIGSIIAIAPFERKGRGIVGRRKPRRSIAILADDGTNLVPIPTGVRWKSVDPDWRQDDNDVLDSDLVDQILAETVESELPDDEFGDAVRRNVRVTPTRRIKQLKKNHPDLGALVVPLHGMPAETEDELRESLPGWI